MSISHTIDFVVSYTDPDRPVDGDRKTRHFNTEEEARQFIKGLPSMAPRAYQLRLERLTHTIRKETLVALDRVY